MSLQHPKNKTYIRFLRIVELVVIFPITVMITLIINPSEIVYYTKTSLEEWFSWFKEAQDFEYH